MYYVKGALKGMIFIDMCLQVLLHGKPGGPTYGRHNVDHVPEASGAMGLEESTQLGEDLRH